MNYYVHDLFCGSTMVKLRNGQDSILYYHEVERLILYFITDAKFAITEDKVLGTSSFLCIIVNHYSARHMMYAMRDKTHLQLDCWMYDQVEGLNLGESLTNQSVLWATSEGSLGIILYFWWKFPQTFLLQSVTKGEAFEIRATSYDRDGKCELHI